MTSSCKLFVTQKITLLIIASVTIIIIFISIYAINTINTPNNTTTSVESYISAISADYYENYYYPNLISSIKSHSNSTLSDILSPYADTGFARVPLRQIMAHISQDNSFIKTITDHCDTNTTFVHFYPEPPFESTSYHASYDYSCNF